MTDINKIATNGFSLPERGGALKELALLSLKIALKSFFSTYQTMTSKLHIFDTKDIEDQEIDFNHSSSYCEACAEAVVHFQHFAELVCKNFLRAEHDLLAVDASADPVILYKLLKGNSVNSADLEGLKSIEFGLTLQRLCKLIKTRRVGNGQFDFVLQARSWLKELNILRNRLWHRGIFILRYPALDKLVGEYVLPFVENVVTLPEYSGLQGLWKYENLKCGIDPIEFIKKEFRNGKYDLGKIAYLKELGRAAYENPLLGKPMLEPLDREHQHRAERIATTENDFSSEAGVRNCPVCGVKSLIVYEDLETNGQAPLERTHGKAWRYAWQVKCMCCTFEINHHLKNASAYGFPIEDYWHAEEL